MVRRLLVAMLALALLGTWFPTSTLAGRKKPKRVGKGTLTDYRVLESKHLGYRLAYRVYLPAGHRELTDLPVLYLTDGQSYIQPGDLPKLLDRMIGKGWIEPVIAVFLDSRDPDNPANNRRNRQFFCNRDFIRFVSNELTGEIDRTYPTRADRDGRTILGLSFGGLNSACVGLYAHEAFRGIAMQSPALHPVPSLFSDYEEAPLRDLKIFLSTGIHKDGEVTTRRFRKLLKKKGYEMQYEEVQFGHDWANWKPLLDDALRYYYSPE